MAREVDVILHSEFQPIKRPLAQWGEIHLFDQRSGRVCCGRKHVVFLARDSERHVASLYTAEPRQARASVAKSEAATCLSAPSSSASLISPSPPS
jgi:hypothetical protein